MTLLLSFSLSLSLWQAGLAFGSMLTTNSTLTDLDLSWNRIRNRSAEAVAAGLEHNRGLTRRGLPLFYLRFGPILYLYVAPILPPFVLVLG